MKDDLRYLVVKADLERRIFNGVYADGDALPAERVLTDEYGLSRATVRRALEILEAEGLVEKLHREGSVVRLRNRGNPSALEVIALVAPAQRRFFSVFLDHFQKIADRNGTLVVFTQQSEEEPIRETLFRLRKNGIRDVVIWLDYETLPKEDVHRLRGMGMNLVFFDIIVDSPYADCVCLDNQDAIRTLYRHVWEASGGRTVVYVSRENSDPSSFRERSETFRTLAPLGVVWDFPWNFKNYLATHDDLFVFDHLSTEFRPGSVICSDGELGIELKKTLLREGIPDILLACVDDFPECEELGITCYRQPYPAYAQRVFSCLAAQASGGDSWRAGKYALQGTLVVRR